jgi:hypothetical protein
VGVSQEPTDCAEAPLLRLLSLFRILTLFKKQSKPNIGNLTRIAPETNNIRDSWRLAQILPHLSPVYDFLIIILVKMVYLGLKFQAAAI